MSLFAPFCFLLCVRVRVLTFSAPLVNTGPRIQENTFDWGDDRCLEIDYTQFTRFGAIANEDRVYQVTPPSGNPIVVAALNRRNEAHFQALRDAAIASGDGLSDNSAKATPAHAMNDADTKLMAEAIESVEAAKAATAAAAAVAAAVANAADAQANADAHADAAVASAIYVADGAMAGLFASDQIVSGQFAAGTSTAEQYASDESTVQQYTDEPTAQQYAEEPPAGPSDAEPSTNESSAPDSSPPGDRKRTREERRGDDDSSER